jgi:hypothetical protein
MTVEFDTTAIGQEISIIEGARLAAIDGSAHPGPAAVDAGWIRLRRWTSHRRRVLERLEH